MKRRSTTIVAGVTGLLLLAACTTLGKRRGGGVFGSDGAADDGASQGPAVVSQIAKSDPAVSPHDRRYWLDLRQSSKPLAQIAGSLATGEAEAAEDLARAYLAKNPGSPQGLNMLAAALALGRKYELAAYYAAQGEKLRPGDASLLNIRGLALMLGQGRRMRDYRMAVATLRRAFDADPAQVAAGLNLGSLYLELGQAEAATQVFAEVADRCQGCVPARMGLGVGLMLTRKYDEARDVFGQILQKNPKHSGALYNLALVQRNGYRDNKQAEKLLFALIQHGEGQDAALKQRAHTVLRMIKGEATIEERTMVADDEGEVPGAANEKDAELLMSSSEFEAD